MKSRAWFAVHYMQRSVILVRTLSVSSAFYSVFNPMTRSYVILTTYYKEGNTECNVSDPYT